MGCRAQHGRHGIFRAFRRQEQVTGRRASRKNSLHGAVRFRPRTRRGRNEQGSPLLFRRLAQGGQDRPDPGGREFIVGVTSAQQKRDYLVRERFLLTEKRLRCFLKLRKINMVGGAERPQNVM